MADTVEKGIYQALLVAAQAVALPVGVERAYQGVSFTPTTTTKFVSVEIHFNRSIETDLSLVMDPIRQGFMRTNVMWPKSSPVVDGYEVAGQLRLAFRRGTKLIRNGLMVRIDEDPEIGVVVIGDTHVTIPVTIRWNCQPQVPA